MRAIQFRKVFGIHRLLYSQKEGRLNAVKQPASCVLNQQTARKHGRQNIRERKKKIKEFSRDLEFRDNRRLSDSDKRKKRGDEKLRVVYKNNNEIFLKCLKGTHIRDFRYNLFSFYHLKIVNQTFLHSSYLEDIRKAMDAVCREKFPSFWGGKNRDYREPACGD